VISIWLRAVRIRFLLASVIAVSNGLALAFWKYGQFNFFYAILTYIGVICLHISIDLLNDYWDYKRGIDQLTKRTGFSGGTGILPENILRPKNVYTAGIIFLLLGSSIGAYFVILRGIAIAIILGFAIFAVYFYSTSIVDTGLGELFVAIKGCMIVLGTFYVQTGVIESAPFYVGSIIGILSASVLFINSFPDHDPDRFKGRRTLVIILGRQKASKIFPLFIMITYTLIILGILFGYTKIYSLLCFASLPYAIKAIKQLVKYYDKIDKLIPAMAAAVKYSRIFGFMLAVSLLL
jgi:1,4-dihydroxy-2-naphthoate octaprenyltransferase